VGKRKGKRPLVRPRRRRGEILKWIFRKWDVGAWTGSIWFRKGQMAGICECGNEPSGTIKCGEFLDELLKKDSAPRSSVRRNSRLKKSNEMQQYADICLLLN